MVVQAEILVLDEDVGRQQKTLGPADKGRVVPDAEEDIAPVLAEGAPDPGDQAALAEVLQPHRVPPLEDQENPGHDPISREMGHIPIFLRPSWQPFRASSPWFSCRGSRRPGPRARPWLP